MSIFAINLPEPSESMRIAIDAQFRDRYLQITPTQFLVSVDRATAAQILGRLRAENGEMGRVLIFRVADYFGWHSKDIWEWIGAQSQGDPPLAGEQASA